MCEHLEDGVIVGIDSRFYGIIRVLDQNTSGAQDTITVTGETLEGYLGQRITVYPNTAITEALQGYDAIKDVSTETAAKYFVTGNCIAPTDPARIIPGLVVASDQQRGIRDDRYMTRFEPLIDLLDKCLAPQTLGYKVAIDLPGNRYIFDVTQGTDHTAHQYDNPRVIIDVGYKNLLALDYVMDRREFRNAFYSSLSGSQTAAETYTALYTREGEELPAGVDRREQHLNVSVNLTVTDFYNQLRLYALKDASQYDSTETLTAAVTPKLVYGRDYALGDFVTVQGRTGLFRRKGITMDAQITGVTHTWTSSGIAQTLEFGDARPTRFDVIHRRLRNGGI